MLILGVSFRSDILGFCKKSWNFKCNMWTAHTQVTFSKSKYLAQTAILPVSTDTSRARVYLRKEYTQKYQHKYHNQIVIRCWYSRAVDSVTVESSSEKCTHSKKHFDTNQIQFLYIDGSYCITLFKGGISPLSSFPPPSGRNTRAAPLIQYRFPVLDLVPYLQPSPKTSPRWPPHVRQRTSAPSITFIIPRSSTSTASNAIAESKLGHPVPLSNLSLLENKGWLHPAHTNSPCRVSFSNIEPRWRSVCPLRNTLNCALESTVVHSAGVCWTL